MGKQLWNIRNKFMVDIILKMVEPSYYFQDEISPVNNVWNVIHKQVNSPKLSIVTIVSLSLIVQLLLGLTIISSLNITCNSHSKCLRAYNRKPVNSIGVVMVRMLALIAVDCGFKPRFALYRPYMWSSSGIQSKWGASNGHMIWSRYFCPVKVPSRTYKSSLHFRDMHPKTVIPGPPNAGAPTPHVLV